MSHLFPRPMALEFSLNNDLGKLSNWLEENYLLTNPEKTQSMILGKSKEIVEH
jgi:hypothetical protein